eukprot:TRINITY_DN12278_c0_g1_i3.p1 TRINITY_DN12278_c0_g1~~TRINITY_DN12278_c0_g1_i3.p1  ORF type:complete len:267 (+),score=19.05 TRINITY_DN12278_c0_g1_i3:125-925(+)
MGCGTSKEVEVERAKACNIHGTPVKTVDNVHLKRSSSAPPLPPQPVISQSTAAEKKRARELQRKAEKALFAAAAELGADDLVSQTRVFGCSAQESSDRSGGGLPSPIRECCRWLRIHGLQAVGLFRVPGTRARVNYWKHRFNVDSAIRIPDEEAVETVTSLIIHWFKELKDERGQKTSIYISQNHDGSESYNMQREVQQRRVQADSQCKSVDVAFVQHGVRQLSDIPVSYTHLTLPTKRIVEISVGVGTLKKKKAKEIINELLEDE